MGAVLTLFGAPVLAQDDTESDIKALEQIAADFKSDLAVLPKATSEASTQLDGVLSAISTSLTFAADALEKGATADAIDALSIAKGSLSVTAMNFNIQQAFIRRKSGQGSQFFEGKGLTKEDVSNVQSMLQGLGETELASIPDLNGISDRLEKSGFDIADLNSKLETFGSDLSEATRSISFDGMNIQEIAGRINSAALSGASMSEISNMLGSAVASLGGSLQDAANAVAASIAGGVEVDLNVAAQGLGYSDFGAAVDAYNSQYGTSYTVEQAKEALGQ